MNIPLFGRNRPLITGKSLATNLKSSASNGPNDSANLDFMRAVAVMLVFFVHLYDISGGHSEKWGIAWNLGRLGVLLFFVHTSLVLMWSLERSGLQGWRLPITFYIRRIFRLYPLGILCVLLAFCFDLTWKNPDAWSNLTLTQNLFSPGRYEVPPLFTPMWTLPLEVQMYVVLPLLFVLFRNRSAKLLLALWCLTVVAALVQPSFGERFEIFKYLPCFLGGVIAWHRIRNGKAERLAGWSWPLALVIVSVMAMTANETVDPLHIAVFGLCLGLCVPHFKEIPWPRIRTISKVIARYSYAIYLSHFPIQVFIFNDARHHPMFKNIRQLPALAHYNRPIHWVMVAVLCTAVPFCLFHCIENPGIRLGKKIAGRIINPNKSPGMVLQPG